MTPERERFLWRTFLNVHPYLDHALTQCANDSKNIGLIVSTFKQIGEEWQRFIQQEEEDSL